MDSLGNNLLERLDWPHDTTFEAFQRTLPLNGESVYEYFYAANKHRIKVQNPAMAIPKLKVILESTFRMSARCGFQAMSLRDLCEDAGLSMGGMYNYIGSKEQLSMMVTEFLGRTFAEINEQLLPPKTEPRERLEALIRAHIYMTELFRPWYFFVYMETKNLQLEQKKSAIHQEQNQLDILQALIDDGVAAGIHEPIDSQLTAPAILSLIQDWYLKAWHFRGSGVDVTGYANFVVNSAYRLLGRYPWGDAGLLNQSK